MVFDFLRMPVRARRRTMGDIPGMGLTHYPFFIAPDKDRVLPLTRILRSKNRFPPALRYPRSWPEPMCLE
jgi:hypothetical protein